jgi:hypothetical protein
MLKIEPNSVQLKAALERVSGEIGGNLTVMYHLLQISAS